MRRSAKLSAAAGAAVLVLAAWQGAAAQGIPSLRGALDVEYNNLDSSGGGTASLWSGSGAIVAGLGNSGINLQGNVRYHNLDGSGGGTSQNTWHLGGVVFWRGRLGAFGAAVDHGMISNGSSTNFTSYGLAGEANLLDNLVLVGKGGLFRGSSSTKGSYYGGGVRFYPLPNLSTTLRADRTHFNGSGDHTDYSVMAEYLLGWFVPVSLYGGYTYSDTTGASGHENIFTLGIRFYLGDDSGSLVEHDRTGPLRDPYMPVRSLGL